MNGNFYGEHRDSRGDIGVSHRSLGDLTNTNGFQSNSGSSTEYEVYHLASFSAPPSQKQGIDPEVGIQRMKQMDIASGLWTMRCQLKIQTNPDELVITNYDTKEILEHFPIDTIISPTYQESSDPNDIYNNLLIFSVLFEGCELHLFQSVGYPARHIVDKIIAAGRPSTHRSDAMNPLYNRSISQPETAYPPTNQVGTYSPDSTASIGRPTVPMMRPNKNPFDTASIFSGTIDYRMTDREIHLLNRCFHDIESFIRTLHASVQAYKEVKMATIKSSSSTIKNTFRRRKSKAPTNNLITKAHLPPTEDFLDCLKKIKLSIIIISRLQGLVFNPNPAELINYLFKPLYLVVDATRDPYTKEPVLGRQVVSPLLTRDAILLLRCCLNSEQEDLWQQLGETWTRSKEDWNGYVPPYVPRFYDGYQPSLSDFDEDLFLNTNGSDVTRNDQDFEINHCPPLASSVIMTPTRNYSNDIYRTNSTLDQQTYRGEFAQKSGNKTASNWDDRLHHFANEVLNRNGRLLEVTHERIAENAYELSVQQGEIVELLDSSRSWWRLRNSLEQVGYCPNIILKKFNERSTPYGISNGAYSGDGNGLSGLEMKNQYF